MWLGIRPFSASSSYIHFSKIEFDAESSDRETLGGHEAQYSAGVLSYLRKTGFRKSNVMPKAPSAVFLLYLRKIHVSRIRFDAESSNREILGGHVARYSAVFLFMIVKSMQRVWLELGDARVQNSKLEAPPRK